MTDPATAEDPMTEEDRSRRPVTVPITETALEAVRAYREAGRALPLSDRTVADIIEAYADTVKRLNDLTRQVYW